MTRHRFECLEDAAEAVDTSLSWQFLVGREDAGVFSFWAVSKGGIPLITSENFPGIEGCVSIDSEDRHTFNKMHTARYVGDIIGLELFTEYLTGHLDGITEGDVNPIDDFRQRNPLWLLAMLGGGNT